MLEKHDDFEQAEAWVNEQVGSNAVIRAKLEGSTNILADAYELWTQHQTLQQLENVDELKARLREEVRAELAGETKGKTEAEEQAAQQAQRATEKPSLANVATSKGAATTGQLTLEDLIGEDADSRPK